MMLRVVAIAMLGLLVGCAAVPLPAGESLSKRKVLNFPVAGQKVHAAVNGLVRLSADYSSFMSYSLKAPLSASFYLGRINVSVNNPIWAATLSGKPMYCTLNRAYFDPLVGPTSAACFTESASGYFGKVHAAPGLVWYGKDLEPPVPFTAVEVPKANGGLPLKTEVFYEGFSDGKLFLSEKIYEQRLDSPSRIRPLVIQVGTLPSKVMIGSLSVTVTAADQNAMTFVAD